MSYKNLFDERPKDQKPENNMRVAGPISGENVRVANFNDVKKRYNKANI